MIIEESGTTHDGLPYMIVVMPQLGTRNGYVGIFENNLLYDKHYSDYIDEPNEDNRIEYNFNVHGGITYSGKLGQDIIGAKNPYYFGFDCNHLGDSPISVTEMSDIINNQKTISEQEKITAIQNYNIAYNMFVTNDSNNHTRNIEYVRVECAKLSNQLMRYQ